jgi:uncharacterized protein YggU (UPF0235/DUF167 family)
VTAGRPAIVQDGPDVLLAVRVQPGTSRNQLVVAGTQPIGLGAQPIRLGTQRFPRGARGEDPGRYRITLRLTAPPVEGAANAACRAFLAHLLGIAQSRILILRGETSRNKLLRIRDADAASILARLQSRK